jgi:TrmH family RNA methyltransferase
VGAVFGIPVAIAALREIIEYAERERHMILGAALQATDGFEPALTKLKDRPLMLAIGSEADGLSPDLIHAAQKLVRIEHSRSVESLNSAIAGSILMRECYDRRLRRS